MIPLRFRRTDARLVMWAALVALPIAALLAFGTASPLVFLGAEAALVFVATAVVLLARIVRDEADSVVASVQASTELTATLPLRIPLPPMTGWAAHPELAATCARVVLSKKPKLIVECGSGVSTLVNAYAVEKNGIGRVVSLDHDPEYAERTRETLRSHGLSDRAQVVDAKLVRQRVGAEDKLFYELDGLPNEPIDFLLVDGPPVALQRESRHPAVPLLIDRLSDGAIVMLDDAARADERAIVARWLAEYPGRFEEMYLATRKGVRLLVHRRRS